MLGGSQAEGANAGETEAAVSGGQVEGDEPGAALAKADRSEGAVDAAATGGDEADDRADGETTAEGGADGEIGKLELPDGPGMKMALPETPLPNAPPIAPAEVGNPAIPAGMNTISIFGTDLPNPFYERTTWTEDVFGGAADGAAEKTRSGASGVNTAGSAGGAAVKGAFVLQAMDKAMSAGSKLGGIKSAGAAGLSKAGLVLGPLSMATGALTAGVAIHDAITEGPGLFEKIFSDDYGGFDKAGAAMRVIGIGAGLLAGLTGVVAGLASTVALVLTKTGKGALLIPKVVSVAVPVGKISLSLTVVSTIANVLATGFQQISAMDEAAQTEGIKEDAAAARSQNQQLLDNVNAAGAHEIMTEQKLLTALGGRSDSGAAGDPIDLLRAQTQAQFEAEDATLVANDAAANLRDESSPLGAAFAAHEASAVRLDQLLRFTRDKQSVLQDHHSKLDWLQGLGRKGTAVISKALKSRKMVDPICKFTGSTPIQEAAAGVGPLANLSVTIPNPFGKAKRVSVPNKLVRKSAQASLKFSELLPKAFDEPADLVSSMGESFRPLTGTLDGRDKQLGEAVHDMHRATDLHNQVGALLERREADLLATFGVADKTRKGKLSLRDGLSPRIRSAIKGVEEAEAMGMSREDAEAMSA